MLGHSRRESRLKFHEVAAKCSLSYKFKTKYCITVNLLLNIWYNGSSVFMHLESVLCH